MRTLAVTQAEYIDQYRLRVTFSDATSQVIDFGPFLLTHPDPQHDKYRKLANFKRFKIERGNVVWGRDWDLIFPVAQLHQGYVGPAVY
ncbi:DUF2442 domain-containing protein [Spirosoma aerophilum]